VRNSLAWWDQGALNWALEYNDLRENILYDNRYCTGGDRRERKDVIDLLTNGINWNAAILHFCGRSKPWERWPGVWLVGQTADDDDLVGYKERLDVFVLSHSDAMLRASPKRTYLRPVNLDRLDIGRYQENHLAESRIFLSDVPDTGSEYVGFATARWDGKYHPPVSRLGHLGRLPLYPSTVYSPDVFGPNWAAHSDQHHPGMYKLLKEMAEVSGLRLEAGPTFYGQNFICHRSVYDDFIKVWRPSSTTSTRSTGTTCPSTWAGSRGGVRRRTCTSGSRACTSLPHRPQDRPRPPVHAQALTSTT
jgi:hypothetical protein